jgi:hypothetical protein
MSQFDPFPTGAPDDIVQGVYKYLLGFSDVVNLLGASDDGTPFLYNGNIYHRMAGTQSCAIVVSSGSGWAAPNTSNTAEFPRIQIDVWSDPPRDDQGQVTQPTEARTRAFAVYQQLNAHLHVPFSKLINFGGITAFGSIRLGEPGWLQNYDSDQVGKLTVFYGISMIIGGVDP